jgi:hypothetical protein
MISWDMWCGTEAACMPFTLTLLAKIQSHDPYLEVLCKAYCTIVYSGRGKGVMKHLASSASDGDG